MPTSATARTSDVTVAARQRCLLGEGPLFDPARDCVFWTDIDAGRLYRLDRGGAPHREIYSGAKVGGFTLQLDGGLVLFRENDIALFDPEGGTVFYSLLAGAPGPDLRAGKRA